MYARVWSSGVHDRVQAEDLTQEVFVRVLTRLASSAPDGPVVRAYLVRAAEHLVADRRRRMERRGVFDDPTPDKPERAEGPSAEDEALARVDRSTLLLELQRLPELQRRVLRLRIVDELSAEAVSAIVGRSPAAVRQIQHRAIESLRRRLERDR